MLDLQALTLGYEHKPIIHRLSARFAAGSLTAVVGPNGAGKTTLLRAIVGELAPLSGRIETSAQRMAWLPQQPDIDRGFPIDVMDFVAMGLWQDARAFRRLDHDERTKLQRVLESVGLENMRRRPIGDLSGGQMQRARFARLMLQDAELILLDEPFTALDAPTEADLLRMVKTWHRQGRTVIAVLHDLQLVREHFPECLLLTRDKIAHGPSRNLLADPRQDRVVAPEESGGCSVVDILTRRELGA